MFYALYIASVIGAVALLLMMPRRGFNPTKIGALLGAAALGGLWLALSRAIPWESVGVRPVMVYYYLFSAIAIAGAVRVITHTKPVFSALWFVLVVLASAGLFLLLNAEFIAFAMVIIYGGAILVTYVFVIMLAAQSVDPERVGESDSLEYDRVAREPVAAVAAGFLLLAALLTIAFQPLQTNPRAVAASDAEIYRATLNERPSAFPAGDDAVAVDRVTMQGAEGQPLPPGREAVAHAPLENAERVGLDLFEQHPLGLELAGVILLVSLVGAVVIARKRVEGSYDTSASPLDAGPLSPGSVPAASGATGTGSR